MSGSYDHIYLITGPNSGLGRAIFDQLVARERVVVIAGVRDPSSKVSQGLQQAARGQGSKVITVKIDSTSESDAHEAVKQLQEQHGITKVDTVIPNAGYGADFVPLAQAKVEHLRKHVEVNGIGPFILFQAVLPLLQKAEQPRFVLIGSPIASISGVEERPFPMGSYAASKAMAHYLVRKIHAEHPDITAFAVDPGFVQTGMGNTVARQFGMAEAPMRATDSASFVISKIDESTRESLSGRFPSIQGGFIDW